MSFLCKRYASICPFLEHLLGPFKGTNASRRAGYGVGWSAIWRVSVMLRRSRIRPESCAHSIYRAIMLLSSQTASVLPALHCYASLKAIGSETPACQQHVGRVDILTCAHKLNKWKGYQLAVPFDELAWRFFLSPRSVSYIPRLLYTHHIHVTSHCLHWFA